MSYDFFTVLDAFDEDNLKKLNDALLNIISTDSFRNNTDVQAIVTFPSAGVDVEINHNNGRILSNYVIIAIDSPAVVYTGLGTNTTSSTFLRCSMAGTTAKVILF